MTSGQIEFGRKAVVPGLPSAAVTNVLGKEADRLATELRGLEGVVSVNLENIGSVLEAMRIERQTPDGVREYAIEMAVNRAYIHCSGGDSKERVHILIFASRDTGIGLLLCKILADLGYQVPQVHNHQIVGGETPLSLGRALRGGFYQCAPRPENKVPGTTLI